MARPVASGVVARPAASGMVMLRAIALALAFALCNLGFADVVEAQSSSSSADLDRIEAEADSGRTEEARSELARWFEAREGRASPGERARARFLRARLTPDADSARADYLWIAIDGGAEYGAAAWLKLAQLDLAMGDPERALQDLSRLRDDYSGSSLVADSWLWAGWAHEAAGRLDEACRAWERSEGLAARRGDGELESRARQARGRCASDELRFTVQLGAFRDRDAASRLRDRAREAGFEARLRPLEGLFRVRMGQFASAESARDAAERLRAAGFSAVVLAGEP